jgi:hypothetical protein
LSFRSAAAAQRHFRNAKDWSSRPVGLAGGFLFAKNARQNVTIPQNSLVTLQVIRSIPRA